MSEKHVNSISVQLSAPVWNLMPFEGKSLLAIEQRDELKRQVSFSVYNFAQNQFLWRDVVLPEKWWINLTGFSGDLIVLKVFESTENPDKTSFLFLEAESGKVTNPPQQIDWIHTINTFRPFQYHEGEPDFATVKNFLSTRLPVTPKLGAEYLEYDHYVILSYYVGDPAAFVNRLALFNLQGECYFDEEIGTKLKGIGINTFFVTSGYLFFVKNKTELVTFRIV